MLDVHEASMEEKYLFAIRLYDAFKKDFKVQDSSLRVCIYLLLAQYIHLKNNYHASVDTNYSFGVQKNITYDAAIDIFKSLKNEIPADDYSSAVKLLESKPHGDFFDLIHTHLRFVSQQVAWHVLEYFISKLMSRHYDVDFAHQRSVSGILSALKNENEDIVDLLPYRVISEGSGGLFDGSSYYVNGYEYEHSDVLRLVASVTSGAVAPIELEKVFDSGKHGARTQLLLIDSPRLSIRDQDNKNTKLNDGVTSLAALEYAINTGFSGRLLVILPVLDAATRTRSQQLKSELLSKWGLEAITDFEYLSNKGKLRKFTAWLIDTQIQISKTVCINDTLLRTMVRADLPSSISFSGGIYRTWIAHLNHDKSTFKPYLIDHPLQNSFEDGYIDIPDICQQIDHIALISSGRLVANAYIEKSKNPTLSVALINRKPLLDFILRTENIGRCAYVIGNNGTGKSMLLRDLAYALAGMQIRSAGVSFSLADRFPSKDKEISKYFSFRGERTSEETINLKRRKNKIYTMAKEIYCSQQKLDLLSRSLEHLGYGKRHYLIPVNVGGHDRYENAILLSASARENAELFSKANVELFELGLLKEGSHEFLSRYSRLSSGEQQIISLLFRIISKSDLNKVYFIDEPEISLHIKWQQILPAVFDEIVQSTQSCIVVATHSPTIIANVSNSKSACFVVTENGLDLLGGQRRSSVETVIFDGFKTYTPHNREVHERCASLVAQVVKTINSPQKNIPDFVHQTKRELEVMEKRIINSLGSFGDGGKTYDLEVVAKAIKAIDQIAESI